MMRYILASLAICWILEPKFVSCDAEIDSSVSVEIVSSASLRLMVQEKPHNLPLRVQLVRALMRERDFISGASECLRILEENPANAEAHLYLARAVRLLRGDPAKCLEHARRAASLDPGLPYQKELLDALYFLKRYDEALKLAQELAGRFDDPGIRYNLAVIYMRLGRREEMRDTAHEILKRKADFVPVLTLLASDEIDYQNYEKAASYVARAMESDPGNLLARYLHGRIALAQGDLQTARKEFEFVVDRDPFHHHALFQLARVYTSLGLRDEAANARRSFEAVKEMPEDKRERFRSYLQTHPDTADTHWRLGVIYLEIQRGNLAARELSRVLEHDPRHADALFTLAGIYMASHDWETALGYLDRAIQVHPDRPAVLFARAAALSALGKNKQAEADLRKILSIDPENQNARRLLEQIKSSDSPKKSTGK